MKKKLGIVIVSLLIMAINFTTSALCESGQFGLGIITGEPTGVSMKYWMGKDTAIDGAVAWSFAKDANLHVHADWLHHNWSFLKNAFEVESGELPLYYGIGSRIRFDDDTRLGMRFVIGMEYIWDTAPFDLFFEAAPILDIAPETTLEGNVALGVRYWFE